MNVQMLVPHCVIRSPLSLQLDDLGSAFVHNCLVIPGIDKIDYVENYQGMLAKTIPVPMGRYECTFVVSAYKDRALGPVYDSTLKVNGELVARASGALQETSDSSYGRFTLDVIQ